MSLNPQTQLWFHHSWDYTIENVQLLPASLQFLFRLAMMFQLYEIQKVLHIMLFLSDPLKFVDLENGHKF